MYICSCRAVTDGHIKKAVAEGIRTFRALCKELGCGTQCGICARYGKEIFDQAKKDLPGDKSSGGGKE